ncbi:MAG TPA: aldo/keto reductase [Steroidobacteraceae bacterium]|nr:aldo/keto reductase [Steroidobacteraceae bacterium]
MTPQDRDRELQRPAHAAGTLRVGDYTVHRLGYGAMRLSGKGIWGDPADRMAAMQVLRRAVELGVDFIDTADAYGPETNETLIADALHPYPAGLVIATKGGLVRPGPSDWERDGRPEHLRAACEASLTRLRADCIDLYQLHAPDPAVPIEDSLGELARLKAEGKIRHVGVSNFDVEQLERGLQVVEIVSVQNRYNVEDRSSQAVLDWCERRGVAFIPWFPLGAGDHTASGAAGRAIEHLAALAKRHDATLAQAAIAWLLAKSPVMLPIPGTSSIEHLEENVAAASIAIDQGELRAI